MISDNLWTLSRALAILVGLYFASLASIIVYNIFFHPLKRFPGPTSWAASRVPWATASFTGNLPYAVADLHSQYGPVVRTAPDELSLIDPLAWKDIMGAHKHRPTMQKDKLALISSPNGVSSILTVESDVEHSRIRRVLAQAFSEKAMREQEPLIQQYIDMLIESLHIAAKKGPVDVVQWYEFVTSDIIGDLTFGKTLGIIKAEYSEWISFIGVVFKAGKRMAAAKYFPHLTPLLAPLLRRSKEYKALVSFTEKNGAMVTERMSIETDRKDFMFYALKAMQKGDSATAMSVEEIKATFEVLMVAGSETTATLLSGVTYQLLKNPEVLKKLVAEIRSSFSTSKDITMVSVTSLKYQLAVLDEALRIMPPAAALSPRIVPKGGEEVAGHFLPGGTRVSIPGWAASRSSLNFKNPNSFIPERWLGDHEYASDRREASQPFNIGPRGCIGRNLAYAEMRLILARILFEFDLELVNSSKLWLENLKNFSLWQKDPLMVNLKPVIRN